MHHHLSSSFPWLAGCGFLIGLLLFSPPLAAEDQWQPWPDDTFASSCPESALPDGAVARLGTRRFVAPGLVEWMAFSADDRSLLSVDVDDRDVVYLRAWDPATGCQTRVWRLPVERGRYDAIVAAADPGSRVLAVSARDKRVLLWDLVEQKTKECLALEGRCRRLFFSRDGGLLATTTRTAGFVEVWDLICTPAVRILKCDCRADRVEFSRDNKLLATIMDDGTAEIWHVRTGQKVKVIRRGDDWATAGFMRAERSDARNFDCVSHDGSLGARLLTDAPSGIAAGLLSDPSRLVVHRTTEDSLLDWRLGHALDVYAMSFPTAHETITTYGYDDYCLIWDIAKRRVSRHPIEDTMLLLAVASVGDTVAVQIFGDGSLAVLRVASQETFHVADINEFSEEGALLSPDGTMLAYIDPTGPSVCCWDVRKQQLVRRIAVDEDEYGAFALSADGQLIGVAGDDDTIRFWNVSSGRLIRVWKSCQSDVQYVSAIHFSPDGQYVAVVDGDNRCSVLTVPSGRVMIRIHAMSPQVAFSPDGRLIAVGGIDGSIRLADLKMRHVLDCIGRHAWGVNALLFSPDGKYLASAGQDMTVLLWDVERLKQMGADREKARRPTSKRCLPLGKRIRTNDYRRHVM